MSTRIFVTGGTGFLGGAIVETAVARGGRPAALVRDRGVREVTGADVVHGDLDDPASYAGALAGRDAVIHAAATSPAWGPYDACRARSVQRVRALVDAAAAAGVKRFVLISSALVYGPGLTGCVTEEQPARVHGDLCPDAHADAEAVVREAEARGALEAAIVRPALCYGPRDRDFVPRMCVDIARGRTHLVGFGWGRLLACDVSACAEIALRCAELPVAAGQAFHAVDRDTGATWGRMLRRVKQELGSPWPMAPVPAWIARALAGFLEARAAGAEKPPPLTRHVVDLMTARHTLSDERARNVLGMAPGADSIEEIVRVMQASR